MIISLLLSMLAGGLTIFSPCVLPIAPLVMGSSLQASKFGPLALLSGMIISFAVVGTFAASILFELGLSTHFLTTFGASLLALVGVFLFSERLSEWFKKLTSRWSARLDAQVQLTDSKSLRAQFLIGLTIGFIWAPCTGPTLGAAISLAVQGESLLQSFMTMVFFGLGASVPLAALGFGARRLAKHRQFLLHSSGAIKKGSGLVFIVIGLMIILGWDKILESQILKILPEVWVNLITSV